MSASKAEQNTIDRIVASDDADESQQAPPRFEEGKPNAHLPDDPKDSRTMKNRLASESHKDEGEEESDETKLLKEDATFPAKAHGNKPSRGAEVDQMLKEEDEAALKKKGGFGPDV